MKSPLLDLCGRPNVRYFEKCPGRISQPKAEGEASMRAAMPARTPEILAAVRELARQGFAAELDAGAKKQPLTFVDVYRQPKAVMAHVIYYGDGEPEGLRLRVADWLATAEPTLYSPHTNTPLPLKRAAQGWIELPRAFARYAAVRFAL
jgi:hypothetical protein